MAEIEQISTEDEYKEKYLRALADYQNLKKHSEKQYAESFSDGEKSMLISLLPFIDDFERIIQNDENDANCAALNIVHDKLVDILSKSRINVINPEHGSSFNDRYHNAIMAFETDDIELDGKIKDVFSKGYERNGNVIRYAKVTIYKYVSSN